MFLAYKLSYSEKFYSSYIKDAQREEIFYELVS